MFRKSSWIFFWIPLVVTCASIVISFLLAGDFQPGANVLGGVSLAGLAYFFIAMIVWFAKKRPAAGLGALACLLVSGGTLTLSIVVMLVYGFTKGDTFADGLTLPAGVALEEPRDGLPGGAPLVDDTFQDALRAAIAGAGGTDPRITTSIPSLGTLQKSHPDLLQQYLAAHPGWRVYKDGGRKFATRRWAVDGRWETSLHGYYSNFHSPSGAEFQTRTTLGLSGKAWARGTQSLPTGKTVAPKISMSGSRHESRLAFDEGDVKVILFEQAVTPERRMTKAAIAEIERELAPIAASPTWATAKARLPAGAITTGAPSFTLYNSMQPGIYSAEIRGNPGEPGRVYLKAFEITKGTQLSRKKLEERACEFVGWSKTPGELFLSEVQFTIYEGDWGQYYGARFEVWFDPESGGPERKLIESNWKIEGWMH
jgi:hypothetical protein